MDSMSNNETTAVTRFGEYTPDPRLKEEAAEKPWLEAVKIAHGISAMVAERKASVGDYTFSDNVVSDEDGNLRVVLGPPRPNAIWLDPDNGWKPKAQSYDLDSDEYKQIKTAEASKAKGAKTGPEFLVYLIDAGQFATFHLTGMAKGEVNEAYAALNKSKGQVVVVLGTKLVGKKKVPVPTFTVTDEPAPAISEDRFNRAMGLFTAFEQQTGADAAGAGDRPR